MRVSTLCRRRGTADGGFTLIEALITIAIAGIVMAIAIGGMGAYLRATREHGTATEIQSAMREAGERSLSEGQTYCVRFTETTWETFVHDCTVSANARGGIEKVGDSSITLAPVFRRPSGMDPTETTACPDTDACAYFYPRGNALGGTVTIKRGDTTYAITVEGVTGRVSAPVHS